MKSAALAVGLTAFASQAFGHYIFERFTYGGDEYDVYQYIRPNTNYNSPITDLTSNDLRCNQGGETGTGTDTIAVTAGSEFTFTTDVAVYHDGPLSIYMAKAPTTAEAFDGSGQVWFKILDIGPTFNSDGTSTWDLEQSYTYTIPSALPNGEYLLRVQQLAIHNPWPAGIPQFYLECAQISVSGGGSGTPGPLVSIPGYIDGTEPGYTVNIYYDFFNYTVPGPAVWTGQNGAGGASSVSVAPASTTAAATKASTTAVVATATSAVASTAPTVASSGTVAEFGQCGGIGWTGATACVSGLTCQALNDYYSQCLS